MASDIEEHLASMKFEDCFFCLWDVKHTNGNEVENSWITPFC